MSKNLTPAWNSVPESTPEDSRASFHDGRVNRPFRLDVVLRSLRRHIYRLLWIHGMSWFVTVVVGLTLVIGTIDWLVHLDAPVCRSSLAAAIVGISGFVAFRFLITPLRVPLRNVDLALQIERRFPVFDDSLVSAVQFLDSELDSRIGSPELQERVVHRAEQTASAIDTTEVVENRSALRMAGIAIGLCVVCAVAASFDPVAASTAVKRLYLPWSATRWPASEERQDCKAIPQPRASDSAGPTLETLEVRLTPPAYTEKPARSLPKGVGHVTDFVGTRVDILARSNTALAKADLCVNDDQPRPVSFFEDQRHFRSSFTIHQPGVSVYTLQLRDQHGFENQTPLHYQIRGIVDQKPTVLLDRPAHDLTVTTHAVVPLYIRARDDLKLNQIRLFYQRQQKKRGRVHRLGSGSFFGAYSRGLWPTGTPKNVPDPLSFPLYSGDNRADRQADIDYDWDLSSLSLTVDEQIKFCAEATDFYDLGDVHVGRSKLRTLTVVTDDQKTAELASHLAGLLDVLDRIRDLQIRNKDDMQALSSETSKPHQFVSADVDRFKRIRRNQRSIASRLIDPDDGLQTDVQQLVREWTGNHLHDLTLQRQFDTLTAELHVLETKLLPVVEDDLVCVSRLFSTADQPRRNIKDAMTAIHHTEDHQSDVIESIERMRVALAEWRVAQDLLENLHQIIVAQETLNRSTVRTGNQTLAQPLAQLSRQRQADLAGLARQQRQQAEHLDRFRQKIAQEIEKRSPSESTPPNSLQVARQYLDHQATENLMLDAVDHIHNNRIGQAVRLQQTVMQQLTKLDELIRNPTTDPYQLGFDSLRPNRDQRPGKQDIAGQRVANEQWHQLVTQLNNMITRQQEVIDETERLATEKAQRGNWSRSLLISLIALTDTQRKLEHDVYGLSKTLPSAQRFDDPSRETARAMKTAADRLAKRETDAVTVEAETMAKQRLSDLVTAIRVGDLARTSVSHAAPASDVESTTEEGESAPGRGASQGNTQKKSSDLSRDATAQANASANETRPFPWRQLLSERVWGHLPPSVREKMDTISTETTLSQYRDLIRAYYESLAETKRRFGEVRPVPKPRRNR